MTTYTETGADGTTVRYGRVNWGYFAGGYSGSAIATTDKVVFSTEITSAQPTANLTSARQSLAGVSEGQTKAYFFGGTVNGIVAVNSADKVLFSTDTTSAQTSANLSTGRYSLAGLTEGNTKGYVLGGRDVSSNLNTADKITFSTDVTSAQTSANLTSARSSLGAISEGSSKGYASGGDTCNGSCFVVTTDKVTFSTDTTTAQTSANLLYAGQDTAGKSEGRSKGYYVYGSSNYRDKMTYSTDSLSAIDTYAFSSPKGLSQGAVFGYFSGGVSTSYVKSTYKTNYATDGISAKSSADMSVERVSFAAVGSDAGRGSAAALVSGQSTNNILLNNSYVRFGRVNWGYAVSSALSNKIVFATDTSSSVYPGVVDLRSDNAAISEGVTKGYLVGGFYTSYSDAVVKVDFPTDTSSLVISTVLSSARTGPCGLSEGKTKGYAFGGNSGSIVATADKVNFSTDAFSAQTSANLSVGRYIAQALSEGAAKGYISGGYTSGLGQTNVTDRISFSTDSTSSFTSCNLSGARGYHRSISEGRSKGYFAGGISGLGTILSIKEKLDYITDSISTSSAIPVATYGSAGISEGNGFGYLSGGGTSSGSTNKTYKTIYQTDVTSAQASADLTLANNNLIGLGVDAGRSEGPVIVGGSALVPSMVYSEGPLTPPRYGKVNWGYFAGGNAPTATTDKIVFSTEITSAQTTANLSLARGYVTGCSEGRTKAYFSGGFDNIAYRVNTDKVVFATDTATAQTSADLSVGRWGAAGLTEGRTKGYISGGYNGNLFPSDYVVTTDLITFSTDTSSAVTGANLSQGRSSLAALSEGDTKGFFFGGETSSGFSSTADKVTFSTNVTSSQTSSNLIVSRAYAASVSEGRTKGYVVAGYNSTYLAGSEIFNYSSEVFSNGNSISLAVSGPSGLSNGSSRGYVAGGINGATYYSSAYRINFSTNIFNSQTSANLTLARADSAAVGADAGYTEGSILIGGGYTTIVPITASGGASANGSGTNNSVYRDFSGTSLYVRHGTAPHGYFAGGFSTAYVTAVQKLVFSTDTTSSITSATLSIARGYPATVTDGRRYVFFAGGRDATNYYVRNDLINIQTDTRSNFASSYLGLARGMLSGVSAINNGYFCGGNSGVSGTLKRIDKISFSTFVTTSQTSDVTRNLQTARYAACGFSQGGTKGFVIGGYGTSDLASSERINFSTDQCSIVAGMNISVARRYGMAISEGRYKGYFAGGVSSARSAVVNIINYSLETTSVASPLSVGRYSAAGLSEGLSSGYLAGGNTGANTNSALKCNFLTDTFSSAASANLSSANLSLAAAGVDAGRTLGGGFLSGGGSIYVQMASVPSGVRCGGIATAILFSSSPAGAVVGGEANVIFLPKPDISGGAVIGGDGSSIVLADKIASGGVLVGGKVDDVIASGGVVVSGFAVPTLARGGVVCGGSSTSTYSKNFLSDGGEILTGGEATTSYKLFFNQPIEWNTKKAIVISRDFEWNTGEQILRWYRVQGRCEYPTAVGSGNMPGPQYPGGCDVIGIETDDESCLNSLSKQQFVQNFVAVSLRDLCNQITNSKLNWPIASIKVYSRPVDTSLSPDDDQCNTLTEVPYCDIPACLQYCVDTYAIVKAKANFYVFDVILSYQGDGVVYTGGSAAVSAVNALPTNVVYDYASEGGETLTGGDAETSSSWQNEFMVEAGAIFEIESFEAVLGEQSVDQVSLASQFVDSCSTCDNMPAIIYFHHNIGNSYIFDNFLTRNGLEFPNPLPLYYNSRLGTWIGNNHLKGTSDDNKNTEETWRFVLEWACVDELGGEILPYSYKFSMLAVRTNLNTGVALESRIMLVFPPEPLCDNISNFSSDFNFSFNVSTNYISNNFDILPNSVMFLDKINLFKSNYWSNYPEFRVRLSKNSSKTDSFRKDIISLVPASTPLRTNNTSDIIVV